MKIQLDQPMIEALRALQFKGNKATVPQLDRKTYERVNKVLEAAGGKWSRKDKAHVFEADEADDAQDAIAEAITVGAIIDQKAIDKKVFQYFQTPENLAARMAEEMALDAENSSILEPSAGGGRLIEAVFALYPTARITALELDKERAQDLGRLFKRDIIAQNLLAISDDFTQWAIRYGQIAEEDRNRFWFDRVIMNPPFRHGQDIAHFMLAWKLLKPGGRIVAITSPGWTFRNDAKHALFCQMIEKNEGGDFSAEPLPENTFKESGTGVRTMLIIGDKE